jgi:drug/metabolite transporter (DMT)-like permease
MKSQSAGQASAYSYVQIVFSTLIGIVIFNELPSLNTYLGGLLIVAGAFTNIFGRKIVLRITGK